MFRWVDMIAWQQLEALLSVGVCVCVCVCVLRRMYIFMSSHYMVSISSNRLQAWKCKQLIVDQYPISTAGVYEVEC